jgi:hypothetical protein
MIVKCIVSHVLPLGDGRFKMFVAGQKYDLEYDIERLFFEEVEGNEQADAEQATEE